jgi:hypothetical protein
MHASGGQRTFWKRLPGLSKTFRLSAACRDNGCNNGDGSRVGVDERQANALFIVTKKTLPVLVCAPVRRHQALLSPSLFLAA